MGFQKEFAERLVAQVGEKQYGRLAVNTRLFVKVSCVCKVSRGSFNPPPEVDSMVVKLVPRDPPLDVDFREWDGLMRICFLRKRKTPSSTFKLNSFLKTLESNYKTWCALTSTAPTKTPFKDFVQEVLDELELGKARAIMLDMDTYLKLLLAFNQKGIHFSNVVSGPTKKGGDVGDAKTDLSGAASLFDGLDEDDEDDGAMDE